MSSRNQARGVASDSQLISVELTPPGYDCVASEFAAGSVERLRSPESSTLDMTSPIDYEQANRLTKPS